MTFRTEQQEEADGARAVGQIEHVTAHEQCFVKCLRCWMDTPDYQMRIYGMLPEDLGPAQARRYMRACEAFLSNLAVSVRRPLARHAVDCPCVGQDEAVLLSVLHHAGIGDRFGAAAHAASIVREERLAPVVDAAEDMIATMAPELRRNTERHGGVHFPSSEHLH